MREQRVSARLELPHDHRLGDRVHSADLAVILLFDLRQMTERVVQKGSAR